jgi:hypothetical protein
MLYDLRFVRRYVPIRDVAVQLGLSLVGNMAQCWRPENHQHGDRTPSVGLHERKNICRCFVCDDLAMSPIDLVMSVCGLDIRSALQWITSRYDVPPAPKGRHVQHQERWPQRFRVGTSGSQLDTLIRSGIWASLTPAQRSILPVLQTFSHENDVEISYRGIVRYSGVGSHSTISSAVKRFKALHILCVQNRTASDGLRACNLYRLTLDDADFLNLADASHKKHLKAIALERELRAEAKRQRAASLRVNSLSNECSAAAINATPSRSVNRQKPQGKARTHCRSQIVRRRKRFSTASRRRRILRRSDARRRSRTSRKKG